jgi:hypothetical protein
MLCTLVEVNWCFEEYDSLIFRVKGWATKAACSMLVSCFVYSLTLKLEVKCSSESLVALRWTTKSNLMTSCSIGGWRKLHEELHNLYSLTNIIRMIKSRRMRWAQHVACMGEKNAHTILVGKQEAQRPLGWPRHSWEDHIKMYLRETGWGGMDWINLAQNRDLVNMVMNLWVL